MALVKLTTAAVVEGRHREAGGETGLGDTHHPLDYLRVVGDGKVTTGDRGQIIYPPARSADVRLVGPFRC